MENLKNIFSVLLHNKIVDAILLPQKISKNISQTLIKSPEQIKLVSFEPIMTINSAKILSSLTRINPKEKIGCVLRPCEIKATIELHKLKMVNLDKIFIIGIECEGTCNLSGDELRMSCRVCENIIPESADIVIQTIGVNVREEVFIKAKPEIKEILNIEEIDQKKREDYIKNLVGKKREEREKLIKNFGSEISILSKFIDKFSSCIKCYNCRSVCPICYCRECIFDMSIFEHKSSQYLKWVEKKGGLNMPADKITFHLTRLNHMSVSCIACGMCSFACPMDLPVFELFYTIGKNVQKLFNYIPGRSPEDELPLSTFREDEFKEVGG